MWRYHVTIPCDDTMWRYLYQDVLICLFFKSERTWASINELETLSKVWATCTRNLFPRESNVNVLANRFACFLYTQWQKHLDASPKNGLFFCSNLLSHLRSCDDTFESCFFMLLIRKDLKWKRSSQLWSIVKQLQIKPRNNSEAPVGVFYLGSLYQAN